MFIDTHTHLNDVSAYPDGGETVVREAIRAGVNRMILPGTSIEELLSMKALASKFPQNIRMFIGLHPTELTDNPQLALDFIREELESNVGQYIGVGEIGIDLHESDANISIQKSAFRQQILWALQYGLPINIHCRDGLNHTLEVLKEFKKIPKGAFHCFGGSKEDVRAIREVGDFYFGINGIVTFKNSNLSDTIPEIGLDRIILETDSPYLSPVPFRGKLNDSSRIPIIADKLAEILDVSIETIAEVTTRNAQTLYGKW